MVVMLNLMLNRTCMLNRVKSPTSQQCGHYHDVVDAGFLIALHISISTFDVTARFQVNFLEHYSRGNRLR